MYVHRAGEGPFLLVIICAPACLLITLTIPKENLIFSLIQPAISAFSFLCLIIYILTMYVCMYVM